MAKKQVSAAVAAHEAKMAALKALEDNRGRITADKLIEAASRADHVWHDSFEWDDQKAGHNYRVDQARHIIRTWCAPRITSETVERRSVMYVRDPRQEAGDQGYVSIARVRTDDDLKREVLVAEFGRAAAALQRAYDVADILNARDEVKEMIEKVNQLRERGEAVRL